MSLMFKSLNVFSLKFDRWSFIFEFHKKSLSSKEIFSIIALKSAGKTKNTIKKILTYLCYLKISVSFKLYNIFEK